jgi:arylsulfatase A-like enzyme
VPGTSKRDVLPIPDRPFSGLVTYDAKDPATSFPPIEPLRPPSGAPNVLVVLLDDVGFGASSAFGCPISTPTAERLAAGGLRYTRFHTTALCSPTRQALLTGRNHHAVGMGGITEIAASAPGYNSIRPNTAAPLAEILKLNGYSTAQFGKCHEVPVWQTSPMGPFDAWPDRAIRWIQQQKALMGDKPFFVYFAPGATHAPDHVPTEWAGKYRGRFDQGWDRLREETIQRQKALGVIPADAELTARHKEIPAWDDMPEALKPVLIRQMEVYAGFLEYTDHHVGRLIDSLQDLGVLGDTLVCHIVGDNGASAEGTLTGTFNEMINFNGAAAIETPEFMTERLDDFGGPDSYNHYAVGWAHAIDWTQARDLAKEQPDKLHELQRLWLIEATRYNVLPLDDRVGERLNPDLAGRPQLIRGNRQLLFGGMGRLSESSVVSIKNKSHAVTAEVVVPSSGAEGVIIAQGGSIGGWSLYAKDGRPKYCYNLLGVQRFYVSGDRPIPAGTHQVRMEFAYDGGGLGKGGDVRLFLDDEKVGEGRVGATAAMVFSADDTCDVGVEGGAVVSEDYGPRGNEFTGEVHWVQIDLADAAEDLDHLITPEERLRVAMAKQ